MSLADHIRSILPQESRAELRNSVLPSILDSISKVAATLRTVQDVSLVGSANSFGDDQLNVDVLAEEHIRRALGGCASVVAASSEEDPVEKPVAHEAGLTRQGDEEYAVAFDPLDGSSIIAPNWTVGAIFGIWDGSSSLGQDPRTRQVASILGVFGPRTTAYVALRIPGSEGVCFEVGLGASGWELVRPDVKLSSPPFKTRYFAPANLRSAAEDARYRSLISLFIEQSYTLRYCGGLVPDLVHPLVKGHGVYVSPVTPTNAAKLRRLYELCPVALMMECAGGAAIDPLSGKGVLDRVVEGTDERAGLVCGTAEEVHKVWDVFSGKVEQGSISV